MYKMANITKDTYDANGIEVITNDLNNLWLYESHVETQWRLSNLPALTNKYIKNIMNTKNVKNKYLN